MAIYIFSISTVHFNDNLINYLRLLVVTQKCPKEYQGHSGVGICSPSSCGGTLGWFQFLGDAPWSPSFFSRKRPVTAVTHTDFRHVSQFVGHFYLWLMAWFTYLDDLLTCLGSLKKSQPGHLRKLSEARIALLRFIFEDVEQSALQAVFLILGCGNSDATLATLVLFQIQWKIMESLDPSRAHSQIFRYSKDISDLRIFYDEAAIFDKLWVTASILTSLLLSFTIVVQCMPGVRDWLWYRRGPFLSMLQQRMSSCAHDNLHAFGNVRVHFCFVSFPVQGLRLVSWWARDCLVEQECLVGLFRSHLYNLLAFQ